MDDDTTATSPIVAALETEKAGYGARGLDDRAAQVQDQIDAHTGAGKARAAEPGRARAAKRGRQTRGG